MLKKSEPQVGSIKTDRDLAKALDIDVFTSRIIQTDIIGKDVLTIYPVNVLVAMQPIQVIVDFFVNLFNVLF